MLEGILNRLKGEDKTREHGPALPQLGGPAPDFEAETTHGKLRMHDWNKDRWVVLFSHPADFTPVCTSEFIAFAKRYKDFETRNAALLGSSVDSVYSHLAWQRNIKEKFDVHIPFPIIADLDMRVARLYGMVHEATAETAPVRAVFFIDPARTVRAMIYYPMSLGRNIAEIVRALDGLQMTDERKLVAPANWQPGDAALVPPPKTVEELESRLRADDIDSTDWYFGKRKAS